jgi:Leucine Rich repeat
MLADKIHRKQYHISKEVPSLIEISIEVVSKNFALYPSLPGLKVQNIIDKIIDQVSTSLPITVTGPYIDHESYWKKACESRWKVVTPNTSGWSWKQTYAERHLQELLNKHTGDDLKLITEAIMSTRFFIFGLDIEELPSHLDLRTLFRNIPCINRLKVSFGAKHLGSEYDRSLFGMRMSDAASLAKCIKNAQCLSALSLPCNLIDDELVKMLTRGFLMNNTLIDLDLSHNRIGDHGARRIAKYLFHTEVLLSLNLSDNHIQYEGSRCIGQALRNNRSLQMLNLKHNRLDDKSGAKLCNDLQQNPVLRSISLSANMLSSLFCDKFSELMSEKNPLIELDLSCNLLVDLEAEESIKDEMIKSVENLRDVLSKQCSLLKLDIRNNGIPRRKLYVDLEKEITEIVLKHDLDLKDIPLFRVQTPSSRDSRSRESNSAYKNNRQ